MITLFEYRYRDAGNFKAYGRIALDGELTSSEQDRLRDCLETDGQFVAEQIDMPTLYAELYKWSGGPIDDDLCTHEFVALSVIDDSELPENAHRWGSAKDFLARISAVEEWDLRLSPHAWRLLSEFRAEIQRL